MPVLAASDGRGHSGAIRMEILGARKDLAGVPEQEAPARLNYLVGDDPSRWRRDVRCWERVRFDSVLDGVDVEYRGGGRSFEFDLVVAPETDIARLRISLTGADGLELDKPGELILHSAAVGIIGVARCSARLFECRAPKPSSVMQQPRRSSHAL